MILILLGSLVEQAANHAQKMVKPIRLRQHDINADGQGERVERGPIRRS